MADRKNILRILLCSVLAFFMLVLCNVQSVNAEKLPTVETVDDFYDQVVMQIQYGKMQSRYLVLFDPSEINAQEIRGRAFEKGGYALEAKFSHWSYSWRVRPEGTVVSFKTGYFYNKAQDKLVDSVAESIAKDCEGMSDYEKIKYVYDYIILNSEYSLVKDGAYNNLIRGKSCCNGYAEAFLTIMEKMNIPCQYTVNSSHAWNTVYLEGEWYNIDTTWGDAGGDRIDYKYFLKSNADWLGEGPAQATAHRSYQANHLEQRADYPNYTLVARFISSGRVVVPILCVFFAVFLYKLIGGQQTRRRIRQNEEMIRNLYKLPEE